MLSGTKLDALQSRPQGTSHGRLVSTVGEIPIKEHPHSRRGPSQNREKKMVGRVGFEPTTNWLKANCSTD